MPVPSTATDLFRFDLERCGGGELAGADEAGRGCLAGPLAAAAVVFDYGSFEPETFELLKGIDDSKKMTAAARERLYPLIIRQASRFSVIVASPETIDEQGLHHTNLHALSLSLAALSPCPGIALVDGYGLPPGSIPHESIRKGDSKSACIAAASIIAKVTRDRLMQRLHKIYPQYGFGQHVGYATRAHRAAIAAHGLSPIHRRSFKISPLPATVESG